VEIERNAEVVDPRAQDGFSEPPHEIVDF